MLQIAWSILWMAIVLSAIEDLLHEQKGIVNNVTMADLRGCQLNKQLQLQ